MLAALVDYFHWLRKHPPKSKGFLTVSDRGDNSELPTNWLVTRNCKFMFLWWIIPGVWPKLSESESAPYLEIIIGVVECSVEGHARSSIEVLVKGVSSGEVRHLVQRLCLGKQKVFSETAQVSYQHLDKHRFNFNVTFLWIWGKTEQFA